MPGIRVLLADRTTIPIEDVELGDLVWAEDPETGEVGPRAVSALIEGHGTKTVVDITIDGEIVTATDGHPFWVDNAGAWVDADDVQPGDLLLTSQGVTVTVDDVDVYTVTGQRVHNLTVDDLHSYYVHTGHTDTLVHNCTNAPNTVGSGMGGPAAPMSTVRTLGPGEKIADLIDEGKRLTCETGNEHALVRLASGDRAILSGGPTGITLGDDVTRVIAHTHPYHLPATGPSPADFAMLSTFGQRSSWLLEHGSLSRFRVR